MKSYIKKGTLLCLSTIIIILIFITGCQQQKDYSKELQPLTDKYVEVWNGGNPDSLDAIMSKDFVYHSNSSPDANGIEGIKKVIASFRTAYPDAKLVREEVIFSENKAAARWAITGTNTGPGEIPPTGKSVSIWGESIIHYENGKITEEWVAFDNQSMMEQLGYTMIPPSEKKK